MTTSVPARPLRYISRPPPTSSATSESSPQPFRLDLTALGKTIEESEQKRFKAFDLGRQIGASLVKARSVLETEFESEEQRKRAERDSEENVDTMVASVLNRPKDADAMETEESSDTTKKTVDPSRVPREANLSNKVEDYVRYKSYLHFLSHGTLLPPSSNPLVTDEEYIGGACIGLSFDLARYGVGRATVRDVQSVKMARNLVRDVMDQLLEFDFRNGPLRRKYDGTKYSLKTLETILYELSVTGDGTSGEEDAAAVGDDSGPERKRIRSDGTASATTAIASTSIAEKDDTPTAEPLERIPKDQLLSLRQRMERRDELRETLIKKCRDGQKAAKQSIFALHRGDASRARKLLHQCEECVRRDLLPIVEEEPSLRFGSFGNVLEEYAEGRLFYAWLLGINDGDKDSDSGGADGKRKLIPQAPRGVLLQPDEFPLQLQPEEYLGGLCDLTGEVGRYAVQRGTARDSDGVRQCLETNVSILTALQTMERVPGHINKKMDPLRRSVEKLERMLYELSLVEATGGMRNVAVESMKEEREKEGED